jgi:hypothetical protein
MRSIFTDNIQKYSAIDRAYNDIYDVSTGTLYKADPSYLNKDITNTIRFKLENCSYFGLDTVPEVDCSDYNELIAYADSFSIETPYLGYIHGLSKFYELQTVGSEMLFNPNALTEYSYYDYNITLPKYNITNPGALNITGDDAAQEWNYCSLESIDFIDFPMDDVDLSDVVSINFGNNFNITNGNTGIKYKNIRRNWWYNTTTSSYFKPFSNMGNLNLKNIRLHNTRMFKHTKEALFVNCGWNSLDLGIGDFNSMGRRYGSSSVTFKGCYFNNITLRGIIRLAFLSWGFMNSTCNTFTIQNAWFLNTDLSRLFGNLTVKNIMIRNSIFTKTALQSMFINSRPSTIYFYNNDTSTCTSLDYMFKGINKTCAIAGELDCHNVTSALGLFDNTVGSSSLIFRNLGFQESLLSIEWNSSADTKGSNAGIQVAAEVIDALYDRSSYLTICSFICKRSLISTTSISKLTSKGYSVIFIDSDDIGSGDINLG